MQIKAVMNYNSKMLHKKGQTSTIFDLEIISMIDILRPSPTAFGFGYLERNSAVVDIWKLFFPTVPKT